MQRLEEIATELEEGELSLENSLKVYEEGVELTKFCSSKLVESENKIKTLIKDGEQFNLSESEV